MYELFEHIFHLSLIETFINDGFNNKRLVKLKNRGYNGFCCLITCARSSVG